MRALLLLVAGAWASDLAYPTPPNPFAAAPAQPPPPEDQPVIKGAERIRPRWRPSVKPLLCLGVLGLACVKEVPQETSLLAAFDAHFQRGRGLIPPQLRAEEYAFRRLGAVSAATHMDIFWLGIVGQWLPLVPLSVDALRHWLPALSTAHTIILLSALGYVLRRLLPRSVGDKSLGYSFRNLAHGRFWSFMSAAFCPTGLVHYLHISLLLLVAMPELEAILGFRKSLMLFAAAGTLAAVGGAIAQAPHRRHAAARSSASGAIAGVLALRAALLPHANVRFCGLELPPGRPSPAAVGAERLVSLVAGCGVAAVLRPQLCTDAICVAREGGWRQMLGYVKGFFAGPAANGCSGGSCEFRGMDAAGGAEIGAMLEEAIEDAFE